MKHKERQNNCYRQKGTKELGQLRDVGSWVGRWNRKRTFVGTLLTSE